jgi:hypothetical protein
MDKSISGNISLICPDCSNHLVNVAPNGERYHCSDCDLRLMRDRDQFVLFRDGLSVGAMGVEDVEVKVTWRQLASAV